MLKFENGQKNIPEILGKRSSVRVFSPKIDPVSCADTPKLTDLTGKEVEATDW